MTDADPKMDFRYTKGDLEIEAYQITPATRWQDEQWPDWIKKQRLADDINCVYTNADRPEVLWLALPDGEVQLPYLAWCVKYADGHLGFIDALEMENFAKVVPNVETPIAPAADGLADEARLAEAFPHLMTKGKTVDDYRRPAAPLAAVAAAAPQAVADVSGDVVKLCSEMMLGIKMLQSNCTVEDALTYLKKCMAARTVWCHCAPDQCSREHEDKDADLASCRKNSPLVN